MLQFPLLTGPHAVGTTLRYITEQTELSSQAEQRELMVRFWYPTEGACNLTSPYSEQGTDALEALNGYLSLGGKSSEEIITHSIVDAPIKQQLWPIIFFEHGYIASMPESYTAICEELASNGYLVVAIAHTGYAFKVEFPDGRTINYDASKFEIMKTDYYKFEDQAVWLKDNEIVLKALKGYSENQKDFFFNVCDMNMLGIIGHSFGGVIAQELCFHTSLFKAGISLDGVVIKKTTNTNLNAFKFLAAQEWADILTSDFRQYAQENSINKELIESAHTEFVKMQNSALLPESLISYEIIPGTKHSSFMDLLILKELSFYKNETGSIMDSFVGTIDGRKTLKNINQKIVSFFNENLK